MNKNKIEEIFRLINLTGAFILMFSPLLSIPFFIITLVFPLKIKNKDTFFNKIYAIICLFISIIFIIIN